MHRIADALTDATTDNHGPLGPRRDKSMGQKTEHPALALMRHASAGVLTRFATDLEVHDVRALASHPHREAFAWILRADATFMAFPVPRSPRRPGFAAMVAEAFGADGCRFYFWDGAVLMQLRCASDLDHRIEECEERIRERAICVRLETMGVR